MALFGTINKPQTITLKITPAQAKREALGKALAMIGGTVSIIGSSMVLSNNPAFKEPATGLVKSLPPVLQENKIPLVIGTGIILALGARWMLKRKILKHWDIKQ